MKKLRAVRSKKERDRLVRENIKLIYRFARLFFKNKKQDGYFYSLEDAQQDACLGLIRAAELYRPRKGTAFSTYAFFWMRQMVDRSFAKARSLIELPVGSLRKFQFSRMHQEGDNYEIPQMNPAEEQFIDKEFVEVLVADLPSLWRKVLLQRSQGKSTVELARRYGVSSQRINQIHSQARERLKKIVSDKEITWR